MAHSIVPHHHHDEEQSHDAHMEHHDNHDHDDDHERDTGLAHDFSNYLHSGTTGDIHQPTIKIECNHFTLAYVTAIFEFIIHPVENPPPVRWLKNPVIPSSDHTLCAKGLRAPPIC
jgi:hypothetical protein